MSKYKFQISFTKPQDYTSWTSIGYFHKPGGESYLAVSFMSYELAAGRMKK